MAKGDLTAFFCLCALAVLNIPLFLDVNLHRGAVALLGFVPIRFALHPWTQFHTLITSVFLHGDIFHLLGNSLFLIVWALSGAALWPPSASGISTAGAGGTSRALVPLSELELASHWGFRCHRVLDGLLPCAVPRSQDLTDYFLRLALETIYASGVGILGLLGRLAGVLDALRLSGRRSLYSTCWFVHCRGCRSHGMENQLSLR